jgi:peptide/nickel transport system ATP-binding protein
VLLDVENLAVSLARPQGAVRLVDDVSFSVRPSETVGLVGESGSGKTLSALAVLRLLPPGITQVAGAIRFRGRDMATLSGRELRTLRSGELTAIFQDPQNSLDPSFTIGSQLVESIRNGDSKISRKAASERAADLLDRVGIANPRARLTSYPHELSGGMAQRVMVALAIANEPKLLVADEPTTALDVTVQEQILELLASLQAGSDLGILLISHDLGMVSSVASRMVIVYAGETVETGASSALVDKPIHPYTRALLAAQPDGNSKAARLPTIAGSIPTPGATGRGCRFAPRCVHAREMCAAPQVWRFFGDDRAARCGRAEELLGDGRPVVALTPRAAPRLDDTALLQVRGITKQYTGRSRRGGRGRADVHAVTDVSFDIRAGETLGLVGESGAGKSTIGRLILGLAEPTSGSITFDGTEIAAGGAPRSLALRGDIQVVFQNPYATLDPHMRIEQSVAEPIEAQTRLSRRARRQRVAELLRHVGLDPAVADRYPYGLSGGQRQRVAIARALGPGPRLIVCDEPVSALDVSTQAQVINLLETLQEEEGMAYLFISHDLGVVHHISDRIAVMRHGSLVEDGPAEEVFSRPTDPYTRRLLASSRARSLSVRDRAPAGLAPGT